MSVSAMLLAAIILVESSFDPNVQDGKNGEIGPMQIRECVIKDVNRHYGSKYTKHDAKSRESSIEIFQKYISIYATKERLKRDPTEADIVRIWNGGPNGYKNQSTMQYYTTVMQAKNDVSPIHLKMVSIN